MSTNLARACHEAPGLPLPRVLAVARDIAAGLAYLHPTVIHRCGRTEQHCGLHTPSAPHGACTACVPAPLDPRRWVLFGGAPDPCMPATH